MRWKEREAALCVPDAWKQNDLDEQVEHLAHEHAIDGLRHLDSRSSQAARRDRDAGALSQLGLQLVELFDGRGEVGIGDENLQAPGSGHAFGESAAFTSVLGKG